MDSGYLPKGQIAPKIYKTPRRCPPFQIGHHGNIKGENKTPKADARDKSIFTIYFSFSVKNLPGKFCRKVVNMHVSCANHLLITEIFSEKLKVLYEALTFPAFPCFQNKIGVYCWYDIVYETYAD